MAEFIIGFYTAIYIVSNIIFLTILYGVYKLLRTLVLWLLADAKNDNN